MARKIGILKEFLPALLPKYKIMLLEAFSPHDLLTAYIKNTLAGYPRLEDQKPDLTWMSSMRSKRRTLRSMKWRLTMAKNFNSSALPEHCYAVLPGSGQLIEVRRGEKGYRESGCV